MNVPNLTLCGRGPYHEIGDFYDRAKVFVNTSDVEGFPNSFLGVAAFLSFLFSIRMD